MSSSLCGSPRGLGGGFSFTHLSSKSGNHFGKGDRINRARGRYLVFLNNDTIVTEGWLPGLMAWALHDWPKVGMVSPVTNYSRPPQQISIDYQELQGLEAFAAKRRKQFAGKAVQTERLAGFCTLIRPKCLTRSADLTTAMVSASSTTMIYACAPGKPAISS